MNLDGKDNGGEGYDMFFKGNVSNHHKIRSISNEWFLETWLRVVSTNEFHE